MDKKASENTTVRNIYSTVENLQAAQKLLVSFMERTLIKTLHSETFRGAVKLSFSQDVVSV